MRSEGDASMRLEKLTTQELGHALRHPWPVALLPVGSVEPHGPHLPLETDTLLSQEACTRAAIALRSRGVLAFIAPAIPYGVTDFAEGFAGALSVPAEALSGFLKGVAQALLGGGMKHVCIVNNHLEPAQDAAVRAVLSELKRGEGSVACPLTRRWGRTLSDEFKRGACHAGSYETSLVLAADGAVREAYRDLPEVDTSLSDGIRDGKETFLAMGMTAAYAGAPAKATRQEGEALYDRLVDMIVTEVLEGLQVVAADSGVAPP